MAWLQLRAASCVMASAIVWGANAQARDPEEAAAVDRAAPPHIVLEPAATDANVAGVVLACERWEGDPVLKLQVYTRNGRRLLPDRRAGARPGQCLSRPCRAVRRQPRRPDAAEEWRMCSAGRRRGGSKRLASP